MMGLAFNDDDAEQQHPARWASVPPSLFATVATSTFPRASSATTYSDPLEIPHDVHLDLAEHRIPVSLDCTVGIYLGDGKLYLADKEALRTTSSFFHDKLSGAEKDLGGFVKLQSIEAIFVLPQHGKPILARISRQDFAKSLARSGSLEAESAESMGTSESVTIKQEEGESDQGNVCKTTRKTGGSLRSRDAHITLLHLMHMQEPPRLNGPFTYMLEVAKHAADLAQCKIYDCVDILRPRLASTLHAHRQDLFLAIKDDPPRIVMLACTLEDESMLTEAMIHMIGCHPCWPESWTPRARLEKRGECTGVLITIQRKTNELRRRCELLDRELLLNTMTVGESQELDITIYPETWLVTQFYRDAIANMLNVIKIEDEDGNEIPDPLRLGGIYRRLLRGGDAFLPIREVFKKFDSLHMPYDHTEVIEDLQRLKDYASGAVQELCQNRLMLNDVEASGVEHLTCADVAMDDMPWVMARNALAAAQQQAEANSATPL